MLINASKIGFILNLLSDSQYAIGIPIHKRIVVVIIDSLKVSNIGVQLNSILFEKIIM